MALDSLDASYSGFGVPNIYVKKVILENTGNGPTWNQLLKENPHIDPVGSSDQFPNIDHVLSSTSNKLTNLKLKVSLNLVLKDIISGGEESWFENDMLLDSYKVIIGQSTNPVVTSALLDKDLYHQAPKIFDKFSSLQGFYTKTKSLFELVGCNNKDELSKKLKTRVLDNGLVCRELLITDSFVTDTNNPKHLAFFLIPYFELDKSYSTSGGFEVNALVTGNGLIGMPVAEIILENYARAKSGMIFYGLDNKPYNGPVHYMPALSANEPGYWMMGESHNDPNVYYPGSEEKIGNGRLKATKLANIKVQDFRTINKIDKVNLNFSDVENKLLNVIDNIQYTTLPKIKPANFTRMSISRDGQNQARFFFGLDFYELAKNNSVYSNLYKLATPDMVESFLANTSIHSMKIKRRRIKETYCENQLLDSCSEHTEFEDDQDYIVDIIAASGDVTTNSGAKNFFKPVSSYLGDSEERDKNGRKKSKVMGALQEVSLNLAKGNKSTSNLRHFTGIDISVSTVTDGVYQYGVEMEIRDGVSIVLAKIINEGRMALKNVRNYFYDLEKNNDPNINSLSSVKESISANNFENYGSYVNDAIAVIEKILRLTTKKPNAEEALGALLLAAHPQTGSIAGVDTLNKILDNLVERLRSILRSTKVGKGYKKSNKQNPSNAFRSSAKNTVLRTSKIEHYFSEIFDADIPRGAGYEFLSLPNNVFGTEFSGPSAAGLLTMTRSQYHLRAKMETAKFFTDKAIQMSDTQRIGAHPKYHTNETVDTNMHTFLGPSHVLVPSRTTPYELLSGLSGDSEYDNLQAARLIGDIVVYNRQGNFLRDSEIKTNDNVKNMSEGEQLLKSKLTSALFARSCTVEEETNFFENKMFTGGATGGNESGEGGAPIVGQLFGKNQEKAPDNNKTDSPKDKLSDSYETEINWLLTDPNSLLTTMLNVDLFKSYTKFSSLKWFDLYDDTGGHENIKKYYFFEPVKNLKAAIAAAPNHIKYLLLLAKKYTETGAPSTISNLIKYDFPNKDILRDQRWQPTIWLNFKKIMRIEVLTSYNTQFIHDGSFAMKSENWKPLQGSDLSLNGNYLCRMVPYYAHHFGIDKPPEELDLPLYHEYFVIKVGEIPIKVLPKLDYIASKLKKNFNRSSTVAAAAEDIHTAIVGNSINTDSMKAKKFLFTAMDDIANTTEPLGMLKSKAPAANIQELAGKPIGIVQQQQQDKASKAAGTTTGNLMGGGSGGTY